LCINAVSLEGHSDQDDARIAPQDFMAQLPVLREKIEGLRAAFSVEITDPEYMVHDIPGKADPDDIVDPYESNIIWRGPFYTTNFLMLDTYSIVFMFNISEAMALRKPFSLEMMTQAYKAVQLFEAMCAYPDLPPGMLIEARVSFAIAFLFLPKDLKTTTWCRRTFANVEALGYVNLHSYSKAGRRPEPVYC